jgi:hypothetical protein
MRSQRMSRIKELQPRLEAEHLEMLTNAYRIAGMPERRDVMLDVRYLADSDAKVFLGHRTQILRAVGAAIE